MAKASTKKPPKLVHSLISLSGPVLTFHAYLVCISELRQQCAEKTYNVLMDAAEEIGVPVFPAICDTVPLEDDTAAQIRASITHLPNVAEKLRTMTDFLVAVWYVGSDAPENVWLMAIH